MTKKKDIPANNNLSIEQLRNLLEQAELAEQEKALQAEQEKALQAEKQLIATIELICPAAKDLTYTERSNKIIQIFDVDQYLNDHGVTTDQSEFIPAKDSDTDSDSDSIENSFDSADKVFNAFSIYVAKYLNGVNNGADDYKKNGTSLTNRLFCYWLSNDRTIVRKSKSKYLNFLISLLGKDHGGSHYHKWLRFISDSKLSVTYKDDFEDKDYQIFDYLK